MVAFINPVSRLLFSISAVILILFLYMAEVIMRTSRSQWPRGLRRRSTAARLLGLWVRIPPGAWMFVLCLLYKDGSMERKVT
jgi:hypothetical protein